MQGLELDWAAVSWDADLRYSNADWQYWDFKGTRWQQVKGLEPRVFLRSAYRVLLIRAPQGMVIFVPSGEDSDPTCPRSFYDETCEYLLRCELPAFLEFCWIPGCLPSQLPQLNWAPCPRIYPT